MRDVNPKKALQQHLQMEDFFTGDFTIRSRFGKQEQRQSKTSADKDVIVELEKIAEEVRRCRKCGLGSSRTNAVPGEGNPNAGIMFVGEGPGADEDAQGRPFVGRAGQLLDKIITAMGLKREDVYICNILKCRPPENRDPKPEEIINCLPYLQKQIERYADQCTTLGGKSSIKLDSRPMCWEPDPNDLICPAGECWWRGQFFCTVM